ncbi:MAG: M28 family peptidase [Acidimicrobiia bacterium]
MMNTQKLDRYHAVAFPDPPEPAGAAGTARPMDLATASPSLQGTVEYLCSDTCLPRLPGTPGGLNAQRFVETAFEDLGLLPAGEDGYLQAIPEISGANVIGMIPGSSPRTIIVGAHFDACAIDGGINPGASDNAASVAAMLEVARELVGADRLDRTVLFIGFDAEEPPYFQQHTMGSRHFVANPTVDLAEIDLMVCLDMVGHAIGDGTDPAIASSMIVLGSEKSPEVAAAMDAVAPVEGLTIRRVDIDLRDQTSDYAGFQDAGIPFLFYNTLRNQHYHATTDTPDTLDYGKLDALVTHLVALVRTVASAPPDPFTYDPEARIDAESVRAVRALLPTLPATSRFASSAAGLLDGLEERAAEGLSESDHLLLRRLFLAVEDGLLDARMWARVHTSTHPPAPVGLITDELRKLITDAIARPGNVVVVTGAGVSAESGIRTYRGDNGLWITDGQEAMMRATAAFFVEHPRASWAWYMMRRTEARAAQPNDAHHAIAEMGRMLEGRFMLIAQNIDRLHPRAGSRPHETIELHGHLEGMRCMDGCSGIFPVPDVFDGWGPDDKITDDHLAHLVCPLCGKFTRPHVLWFDEFYEEENYGFATAQRAVANATLCITAGTSGGVPVAGRLEGIAERAGASLIDVNTRDNPLRKLAARRGGFIQAPATEGMRAIADAVVDAIPSARR